MVLKTRDLYLMMKNNLRFHSAFYCFSISGGGAVFFSVTAREYQVFSHPG